MLSYHADADSDTNPFELGLDRLVNLDMEADFIGKTALRRIKAEGVKRRQVGLIIEGAPLTGPNTRFWAVTKGGQPVGKVTSAIHSPRLGQNIALAMVASDFVQIGTTVDVVTNSGPVAARVTECPFYDPKKSLAAA